MNILWPNDCIFSHLDSFPFLSNPCWSTFVYISCLSDPSLIKLNYYEVSLLCVHSRLCMLCTHAYSDHQSFCISMCHDVIQITMPTLKKIGLEMAENLAFKVKLVWFDFLRFFSLLEYIRRSSVHNLAAIGWEMNDIWY